MSIFIIGRNGYVAKRLMRKIKLTEDVMVTSSTEQLDSLKLNLLEPTEFDYSIVKENDLIVLLAAISSPDLCENEFEYAYKINVIGTQYIINQCLERKAKVLFFSSDIIYGHTDQSVNEKTPVNPLGRYAEMKCEVENEYVHEKNFKSFRLSYVFSKEDKFTKYLQSYKEKQKLEIFHPILRSVVYIEDVLDSIVQINKDWAVWQQSVFNICGPDLLSRVDLVEMYKDIVNSKILYDSIHPTEEFYAARPKCIEMKSLYLEELLHRQSNTIHKAFYKEFNEGEQL